MVYLKIIRPINLGMLLLLQVIIRFGFFEPLALPLAMNVFQFCLLLLATLTIAAAGNVINDIYDTTIDAVNKPNRVIVGNYISEKNAYTFYIILTSLGVCAGFLLANQLGKPGLAAVFIIIAAILYMYASYLSALLLIGNIIVSALVAFALITVILFDIYPMLNANIAGYQIPLRIVLVYAAFAFYFNLLREIVKDIEDVNGDKKGERNTLAIALGRERTRNITFDLGVFALVAILWITYSY
ncbi:MAG: UbiA family prenyltransferase, partial [Marinirhabdus sp.]|nr:UbiA family prenyltransferase [Marinirhabdus sp.]